MACWGFCKARARARRRRRALQRAFHGGVEVATGGLLWAAWHGRGGSSAKQEAVEKEQRDALAPARSRTWPGWLSTAGVSAVLHSGGNRR